VWRADLAAVDDGLLAPLTPNERERAGRMARAGDALLWSRSRGLLRTLLGRYLGADPRALVLAFGDRGKPRLAEAQPLRPTAPGLHFNLSHSGTLALFAFAGFGEVGVDAQVLSARGTERRGDRVALARRVFGPEAADRLGELEGAPREREFLRLWTRYEAELKRRGIGIAGGSVRAGRSPWIAELDLGPQALGAVAASTVPGQLRLWSWSA
jgi:4'-phosphopantetheinyl transferase